MNHSHNNEIEKRFLKAKNEQSTRFHLPGEGQGDALAEKIMENIHNTPLGRLLGIIATLPEIRQEKVEQGRKLIGRKDVELDQQLDVALDRVLEELLHE